MKTLKLNEENYFGVFLEAERILKNGGVIIVPTDTIYGLIARADHPKAVKKIFKIKNRAITKPLSVFVRDVAAARKYAYVSDSKARFLDKVWPGKVTVVFHHKGKLAKELTGGKETIGLRAPDSQFLLKLLEKIDVPLAQTSANTAGDPPAKNMEEVRKYFAEAEQKPDLVVDGGETAGDPSVVIDFTGERPVILRTGIIAKDDFDQMLNAMI